MSAKLFEAAGFAAIGTTSGGVNWSHGRTDYVYATSSVDMLHSYRAVADATDLPVSGDLENGYSDDPDAVADLIRRSIDAGLVGGSIEDHSVAHPSGLVPVDLAAEKIAAARAAADATGSTFTITARAESLYTDVTDSLDDAITRAQRYAEAGADCVFIPGVDDLDAIRAVTSAVDAPVSVGIGSGGGALRLDDLAAAGVRRVSTGGALPRAVYSFIVSACRQMLAGSFDAVGDAMSEAEVDALLATKAVS